MLIDITPKKEESFDCLQCIIVSVLEHFKKEYVLMFSNSWGFSFVPNIELHNSGIIGERLKPGWSLEVWDMLEKYHGVKIEWKNHVALSALNLMINEHIEKSCPVGIAVDGFWCPWDISYQKYHILHYCLIIGIDEYDGKYLCIDPYTTQNIIKIEEETLKMGFKYLIIFKIIPSWKIDIDWKRIVIDALNNLKLINNSTNVFYSMREFADEIERSLDIKKEMNGYADIHTVPILGQLKIIDSSRVNFAKVLNFLAGKFNIIELQELSDSIIQAGNKWSKIRLKLMKLSMLPEQSVQKKKIADNIREIADYEEGIANRLLNLCKAID